MAPQYKIGFSNVTEKLSFAVEVRKSVEAAAQEHPNVELLVRDNDMDNDKALAYVEEFAALPVDLAIISHIDERFGPRLAGVLQKQRIPVMSVEVPIPLTHFFGINNKRAGLLAGELLGDWAREHWESSLDHVLVVIDHRYTGSLKMRMEMTVEGLRSKMAVDDDRVLFLHGGNIRETAYENTLPVLKRWGRGSRVGVLANNDDTALGAIDAARELGMAEHIVAVGQGATVTHEAFQNPASRLIGSTAFHPENYGAPILDLALRKLTGERIPMNNYVEPALVTPDKV